MRNPDVLTRFTGSGPDAANPFISGYWVAVFDMPPAAPEDSAKWLSSTCNTFTPHTRSISQGAFPGIGGLSKQFPIAQEISNSFDLGFIEMDNMYVSQVLDSMTGWLDPVAGIQARRNLSQQPFRYKRSVVIFLMNPSIPIQKQGGGAFNRVTGLGQAASFSTSIRKIIIYPNAWCVSDPIAGFNQDISTNALTSIQSTFAFDGSPITIHANDAIMLYAQSVLADMLNLAPDQLFKDRYKEVMGRAYGGGLIGAISGFVDEFAQGAIDALQGAILGAVGSLAGQILGRASDGVSAIFGDGALGSTINSGIDKLSDKGLDVFSDVIGGLGSDVRGGISSNIGKATAGISTRLPSIIRNL